MDNIKVNYEPPDGWVKKLKSGDFVYIFNFDKLIYEIKDMEFKPEYNQYVILVDAPFKGFYVNDNGRSGGRQIIFPVIKNTFPIDAGDGE